MNEATSLKFEEMYKTYYGLLRNWAENIIGDHDASHDVVQEVFLKLWNRKDELQAILNPKAYLLKSVVHASVAYLEKSKKATTLSDSTRDASMSVDSGLLTKELEQSIQTALATLPPKCKAVFILSRFEELKNKEIAELLGLSVKTVENQMGIALKKMRMELKPYFNREIASLTVSTCVSFLVYLLQA